MNSTSEKLPVLALWSDVLRQMIWYRAELFKISLPLLSLSTILIAAHKLDPLAEESVAEGMLVLAVMFLFIVLTVLAVVRCHNLFIRGPDSLQNLGHFGSVGTEERYARNFVLVSLCAKATGMIFSLPIIVSGIVLTKLTAVNQSDVLYAMVVVCLSLIFYVGTRFSLLLPAVATGNTGMGPGEAWALSAGNSLRLFVAVNTVPCITQVLNAVMPDHHLVLKIVQILLTCGAALVALAVLSGSYRYLTGSSSESES